MARQKIVVGMLLLGLALPLASCASTGKLRMSSSSMCQAHGGTYNAATQSCSYTQSVRTAQQNCEQSHGYYDAAAQVCELGREVTVRPPTRRVREPSRHARRCSSAWHGGDHE